MMIYNDMYIYNAKSLHYSETFAISVFCPGKLNESFTIFLKKNIT